MSISPLRPPASPVQDAPRKISTPPQQSTATQSAPQAFGFHKSGSATRPSNPALQATTGASGFDAGARASGPKTSLPKLSLPQTGAPQATGGASAIGSLSGSKIDAIFNKGSSTFEHILGSLGQPVQPIDDPTARLQSRSDQLGKVLTADPSLKSQISFHDLMQAKRISRIFSNPVFLGSLNDLQRQAVQSYQNTMAMMCAEWPPPPGGGRGNG
ncbi:MAG TPA: hypothetical protein VFA20_00610 [Myxococcaceae bacterium]|nr:hypothetical protein [Myxococcaceae bacterium]